MIFEAFNGIGVADDGAGEPPFIAKNVVKQPAIACGRDVVQIEISAHGGAHTGFDGGVKGLEVHVVEKSFGKISLVVVAAADGGTVAREMLHASEHVIG